MGSMVVSVLLTFANRAWEADGMGGEGVVLTFCRLRQGLMLPRVDAMKTFSDALGCSGYSHCSIPQAQRRGRTRSSMAHEIDV